MRSLPLPLVDDFEVLTQLSNSRAKSAIAIRGVLPQIRLQYESYRRLGGDPWQINADRTLRHFSEEMKRLYKSPPKALSHLEAMRKGMTGACPMCGRDGMGTLDHYLPQANYPDFCIYSPNLIPACDRCNTARSNNVKGFNQGQRAFQPYFDAFANRRIMTIRLAPDWRAPDIQPIPFEVNGSELDIIEWQIENVVKPSGFIEYVAPIWATFLYDPLTILGQTPTVEAITARLLDLEKVDTAISASPNSWKACMYHGVRHNTDAVAYLATRVETALRQT